MEAAAHFAVWTLVASLIGWTLLVATLRGAGDL